MVAVSYDRIIIRDRHYRFIVLLNEVCLSCLIVFHTDISAKTYFFRIFRSAKLKRITIFQPVIRCFYLIAVSDLLLEHTITVTDTASVRCISQCCKRIQETCCQTSESTVTKCRIRLLILDHVQVDSHLFQSFFYFLICRHVDQVVSESSSEQEFHGHVIYGLRIVFLILFLCCKPVIDDGFLYSIRNCLEQLLRSCLFYFLTEQCLYIVPYISFKYVFFKSWIIHFLLPFLKTGL